jgi:hypothetical protein
MTIPAPPDAPTYPITDVPCAPLASIEDATSCGPCKGIQTGTLEDNLDVASAWVWRLTGKRYGVCEITVLPLGLRTCDPLCSGYETWGDSWYFDRSRNCWFGPGRVIARGEGVPEVRLGFANVQEVVQVALSGEILDPSAYRVDDARWLVRTDGLTWPYDQDPRVTPPAFQVTLRHGLPMPPDGTVAVSTLACELALACSSSSACRLPKRIQTITRQGVSMVLLDPLQFLDEGKFGIPEVDYFINGVNPGRNRQRAAVVSPDVPRSVRIPTSPKLQPIVPPG